MRAEHTHTHILTFSTNIYRKLADTFTVLIQEVKSKLNMQDKDTHFNTLGFLNNFSLYLY